MSGRRDRRPSSGALAAAERLLGRRALTRHELTERLGARGHGEADIAAALGRLEAAGIVDDARLARDWIARSAAAAGRGRERILATLAARGIDPALAAAAWARATEDGEIDEGARVARAVRRRLGAPGPITARGRLARVYNALLSEGFDPEAVASALAPYGFERADA